MWYRMYTVFCNILSYPETFILEVLIYSLYIFRCMSFYILIYLNGMQITSALYISGVFNIMCIYSESLSYIWTFLAASIAHKTSTCTSQKGMHIFRHTCYRVPNSVMPWLNISFYTLRPRQDGRHFANDSFKCIFFKEHYCILIKISLKYVCKGPIENNLALVLMMAWCRAGETLLSG